jgi:hypothetical protein
MMRNDTIRVASTDPMANGCTRNGEDENTVG